MGRQIGYGGTRYRVLATLSDMEWRTTRVVATMAGISLPLACNHLGNLERDGIVLRRGVHGSMEWCWWGDGNKPDSLNIVSLRAEI